MLKGKTIVLGVTGSIAAYKMANVASMLVKRGCEVHVVMTKNATNFINPIAFESLTNTKCLVETFDRNFQFHVAHVSLTDKTANRLQKLRIQRKKPKFPQSPTLPNVLRNEPKIQSSPRRTSLPKTEGIPTRWPWPPRSTHRWSRPSGSTCKSISRARSEAVPSAIVHGFRTPTNTRRSPWASMCRNSSAVS